MRKKRKSEKKKKKDHFQYLLSFDLLSPKESLPNALNDACRLLLKKKANDYFYYLPVKGRPTKIQFLEEDG